MKLPGDPQSHPAPEPGTPIRFGDLPPTAGEGETVAMDMRPEPQRGQVRAEEAETIAMAQVPSRFI